jgi:hypothetical protein
MACMFRVLCSPSKDSEKKAGDYDNDFYLMICVGPTPLLHPSTDPSRDIPTWAGRKVRSEKRKEKRAHAPTYSSTAGIHYTVHVAGQGRAGQGRVGQGRAGCVPSAISDSAHAGPAMSCEAWIRRASLCLPCYMLCYAICCGMLLGTQFHISYLAC